MAAAASHRWTLHEVQSLFEQPFAGLLHRAHKVHRAQLVATVKSLGLETCATLGMLEDGHAETLRDAGMDCYNHNLDSAPEFYGEIITTRALRDRLDTLQRVRARA